MIWDESEELMQYEQIYFAGSETQEVVADDRLSEADTVYVYTMRGDACEQTFDKIIKENGAFSEVNLVRELLYCDLYELKR